MSDLGGSARRKLEKLFGMGGGYVLNFSDRTFSDFFDDYRIQIDDEQYKIGGTSKAKRMRTFWKIADNHTVGRVIEGLIVHGNEEECFGDSSPLLINECKNIAKQLLSEQPVAELQSLTAISNDYDFEIVAAHVRESIDKNQPEAALDRLHTFVNKFVRITSKRYKIDINPNKPLNSIFGEYVKRLREEGHVESVMTDRILRNSISILEAFNDVRNNKSLAHDNPILNYEESLLIFNHVAASIRFIKSLEASIETKAVASLKNAQSNSSSNSVLF
ncbi:abortive infection family protein [Psychrobacter celer]